MGNNSNRFPRPSKAWSRFCSSVELQDQHVLLPLRSNQPTLLCRSSASLILYAFSLAFLLPHIQKPPEPLCNHPTSDIPPHLHLPKHLIALFTNDVLHPSSFRLQTVKLFWVSLNPKQSCTQARLVKAL